MIKGAASRNCGDVDQSRDSLMSNEQSQRKERRVTLDRNNSTFLFALLSESSFGTFIYLSAFFVVSCGIAGRHQRGLHEVKGGATIGRL